MKVWCLLLALAVPSAAQTPTDVEKPLQSAYDALRAKDYDRAIQGFREALLLAPERAAVRKDLAYTLLKVGDSEGARDQFGEAMRLHPNDFHTALEYAFLCHETKEAAVARRVFDRVRRDGDPQSKTTAEAAFRRIDEPLAEGIQRWSKVVAERPNDFMAHYELARLADVRDELEIATAHYLRAWQIQPEKRDILVELAKAYRRLNQQDEATAALLAAWRGGEARASETARALLPDRYPFVYEFRRALALDPENVALRREFAYLLLAMDKQSEAEQEFLQLVKKNPKDLLACAQLGLMYLERNGKSEAMPWLERVMAGDDVALANRIRSVLKLPVAGGEQRPVVADARSLAEKSLQAGYLNDALRYLKTANEENPKDPWVQLKLGWTYNVLRQDKEALYWFDLARRGTDPAISEAASKSYQSLRPEYARFRTTVWTYPIFSSRWHDVFTYGQVKTEVRIGKLPIRPYLSVRLLGDIRKTTGGPMPQYLSENALIGAIGLATRPWYRITLWGEAGMAWSYRGKQPGYGLIAPDYRGGLSFTKGFGHSIGASESGAFAETSLDALYVSRFNRDVLAYWQNKLGWTFAAGGLRLQTYMAGNATRDLKREAWANVFEAGPGLRFRFPGLPANAVLFGEFIRGAYALPQYGARRAQYTDVRGGVWYAFSY